MSAIPAPAEDFFLHHSWVNLDEARYLAGVKADDGTPYCRECHDWHHPNEDHSLTDTL